VTFTAIVPDPGRTQGRPKCALSPVPTERVDAITFGLAYLQVMYSYSSRCQLVYVILSYVIALSMNDVISTGVVWWSRTRTFWPFIVINVKKNFISFTNVKANND